MRKIIESLFIWLVIIAFIVILYGQAGGDLSFGRQIKQLSFSEFLAYVDKGEVNHVIIKGFEGREIEGLLKDGSRFVTKASFYGDLINELRKNNVVFEVSTGESFLGFFAGLLLSWLPMIILVGVWVFFMKQMQAGGNRTMTFGKSKARLISSKKNKVTFKDVAGIDEAKEELAEIVDFLMSPLKFQSLGGKVPKGCLLIGPPGTGKTLLAKAIAGEANVPFFIISGSDFVEMFVGVGASRVRDMFDQAKKNAPCLVFIDEIDAVGRHRGIGLGGGNDEREQTLNQLLVEMDGFESNEGVIIIAATNRPDVLDKALLRPGRFDRQITITLPDIAGRERILDVYMKQVPLSPDVNKNVIARGTPGFSGADLANLVNEAALIAARRNKKVVTMDDFEYARDKVMMGAERRSMIMKDEEKSLTAYHEAGHAIIAHYTEASDPIHKATIIPRGRALGLVMRLPEDDRVSLTRAKMKADILVAMGGRVAEEIIFGYEKVTSGASSDIKQATLLARSMVMKWGMSDKIGPIYHANEEHEQHDQSHDTKNLIDDEVKKIVIQGLEEAKSLLNKHINDLHLLAKHLLEFETLTGDEITKLLKNKKLNKKTKMEEENKPIKKSSIIGNDEE
ncbi:MAG: ATP-dependent metallopeptidase FtsH/Yme1/Tma family protein [Rickettsiaceae bacterium H1]|nr:ATP-dependent metallopeptidase FtsH/Yme1/Tma family protein [Rickettsiaceae bacterium H1]